METMGADLLASTVFPLASELPRESELGSVFQFRPTHSLNCLAAWLRSRGYDAFLTKP